MYYNTVPNAVDPEIPQEESDTGDEEVELELFQKLAVLCVIYKVNNVLFSAAYEIYKVLVIQPSLLNICCVKNKQVH